MTFIWFHIQFNDDNFRTDLRMVKRMVYAYRIIQFVRRHDLDRLMQMAVIQLSDENHVVIALGQHQIQPTDSSKIAIVHVPRQWQCINNKHSTKTAPVRPIRVN